PKSFSMCALTIRMVPSRLTTTIPIGAASTIRRNVSSARLCSITSSGPAGFVIYILLLLGFGPQADIKYCAQHCVRLNYYPPSPKRQSFLGSYNGQGSEPGPRFFLRRGAVRRIPL